MYAFQDPDDNISVLQMNSELEHAQLELLSAHCAVHQLRLHYSSENLARFGRRDVLRKSVEAASAIHHFFVTIANRIPQGSENSRSAQPSSQQIAQAVGWLVSYLQEQRDYYSAVAVPLSNEYKAQLWPYFSSALLDRIRVVELRGDHVRVPEFFAKVRELGFEPPEIAHMDSVTFVDLIAFNQRISDRALFHALVHAVQIEALGLQRYAELWVHGFLRTRTHFTVPIEVHAFSLASRFFGPSGEKFSVEDQVLRWLEGGRY